MSRIVQAAKTPYMTRWVFLLSVATLLSPVLNNVLEAGRPPKPRLVPAEMIQGAKPMKVDEDLIGGVPIREAIRLTEEKELNDALLAWSHVALDETTREWKHIARAQLHIQLKQYTEAYDELGLVLHLNENNPIGYVLRARVSMLQAEKAPRYWRLPDPDGRIFVSHEPAIPATKDMLRFAARQDLSKALSLVRPDLESFVVPDSASYDCGVTLGELLYVLELEDWVAESHLTLGRLYMTHGSLRLVEKHLDKARELGKPCAKSYAALATSHAEDGSWRDAVRNHAKSVAAGGSLFRAASNILDLVSNGE